MIDVEPLIHEELARLAPPDDVPPARWHDVRPSPRRAPVVALAALVVLLACGATLAAVTDNLPWWQTGSPPASPRSVAQSLVDVQGLPQHHLDLSRAREVARVGDASLVAVPLGATGYCLVPFLGTKPSGAQCEFQVADAAHGRDDRSETANIDGSWLAYGRFTDPRARTLAVGATSIELANGGFFLLRVPAGVANTAERAQLLDAGGGRLETGCVNWGSPDSAGSTAFWTQGDGPCRSVAPYEPPRPDLSTAQDVLDVTLTEPFSLWRPGDRIAFWQARDQHGRDCFWVTGGAATDTPGTPSCSEEAVEGALTLAIDSMRVTGADGSAAYTHDATGRFDGASVARVAAVSPQRTIEAAAAHGYYFVQLPESRSSDFPGGGPWEIVAYDANGKEVARRSIDKLVAEATPH